MKILTFKNAVTDEDIKRVGEAKRFSQMANEYAISNVGATFGGLVSAIGSEMFINGTPDQSNLGALIAAGGVAILAAFGLGNSAIANNTYNLKERKILRVGEASSLTNIEQTENANKFSETLYSFFKNNIMAFLSGASLYLAGSVVRNGASLPDMVLSGLMVGLGVLGNVVSYSSCKEKVDYLNESYKNIGNEEKVK